MNDKIWLCERNSSPLTHESKSTIEPIIIGNNVKIDLNVCIGDEVLVGMGSVAVKNSIQMHYR